MIHIRISSAGHPTVIVAFREVCAHVTESLFPPGGAAGLLHGGTGGSRATVPDVTNGIAAIKGRRSRLQRGAGACWESLGPVMGAGSAGRQVLGGDGEPTQGCFQRTVGRVGLARWRSARLRKKKKKKARSWLEKRVLFETKRVFSFFFLTQPLPFPAAFRDRLRFTFLCNHKLQKHPH